MEDGETSEGKNLDFIINDSIRNVQDHLLTKKQSTEFDLKPMGIVSGGDVIKINSIFTAAK